MQKIKTKAPGKDQSPEFNVKAYLDHTELFGPLSDKSKELLAEIAIPKIIAKNQTLFSEGDKGFALYLLANGNIQLSKSAGAVKDAIIKIVQPGEVFAEVILFERNTYPVSAIALKKSLLFVLLREDFLRLLENPFFRNDFIVLLIRKQRYLTERIRYLAVDDVTGRLACFLKDQYGARPTIPPNISKKDFAAALGITPETLSRVLAKLHGKKLLTWQGNKITISDAFRKLYWE
ncbi:MAG: Crp/Fnr family transcriptional regulator [Chitinivibrionales bacterium]|nr:Crp/Fnr family transcriptional regulator [Chitinivibrionales bacterium]